MYFDFEGRNFETPTVESAISWREQLLVSLFGHVAALELDDRNQSAAGSLPGRVTLHRLGVSAVLGRSFKTTNCLESMRWSRNAAPKSTSGELEPASWRRRASTSNRASARASRSIAAGTDRKEDPEHEGSVMSGAVESFN